MGRGRKGLIEQSQKKPKRLVETKKRGEGFWWQFGVWNPDEKKSMVLSNDFLEAVKEMEPKEVADILFKNENPQSVC